MISVTQRRRDRGAVIPIVAMLLATLMIMTGFAVDLGRQRSDRRSMQAAADVIALDMSRMVAERTFAELKAQPAYTEIQTALTASAARNKLDNAIVSGTTSGPRVTVLEWGTIVMPAGDFRPFTAADDATVPDAVRITTEDDTDYSFQPGSGDVTRRAVAQAKQEEEAWFKVGSFLAGITPVSNGVLGRVLSKVVPGAELLSYNGLVNTTVTLRQLQAGLTAVSPDTGLDTPITYRQFLLASATALESGGGDTATVQLLRDMGSASTGSQQFTMMQLVSAQAGGGTPAADAEYDLTGLLTGGAYLIDGEHAATVPASQLAIPGIGNVDMALKVIERPQIGGPHEGAVARTGQFDLSVVPNMTASSSNVTVDLCTLSAEGRTLVGQLLGGLISFATCLLGGRIDRALTLDVTYTGGISLVAAGATVTLDDIDCTSVPPRITLGPQPVPLSLVSDLVVTVTGSLAGTSLGNVATFTFPAGATAAGTAGPETFLDPTQFGPPPRRVGSNPLGLSSLVNFNSPTMTSSIVPDRVSLSPIINRAMTPLKNRLNFLIGELDTKLFGPTAQALNLTIGGADLTAMSMGCELVRPRLVG